MSIDVEKLRCGTVPISKIAGSVLQNQRSTAQGSSGQYSGPNVDALRTTSKQVSAISGTVASLKV